VTLTEWLLSRDPSLLHGLFGITMHESQALVSDCVRGVGDFSFGRRPPKEWHFVNPPFVTTYRGILVLASGIHVLIGSTGRRAYEQYTSLNFGSIALSELEDRFPIRLAMRLRAKCNDHPLCDHDHGAFTIRGDETLRTHVVERVS
jgi:hypothetical protein